MTCPVLVCDDCGRTLIGPTRVWAFYFEHGPCEFGERLGWVTNTTRNRGGHGNGGTDYCPVCAAKRELAMVRAA